MLFAGCPTRIGRTDTEVTSSIGRVSVSLDFVEGQEM